MKSIKFSFVVLAALLSIGLANAQIGVQAGYSISKPTADNPPLNGFHVGPVYNMNIQGPISLQYGLLYNFLTSNKDYFGAQNCTTTAHSLDLPVRIAATVAFDNGLSAFAFGGPNFNFGFSQITKTSDSNLNIIGKNIYSLPMSNGKKLFSQLDMQIGAGGGLQYKNMAVRVSYDWGIFDRNKSDFAVWKNNDLKISLVYYF